MKNKSPLKVGDMIETKSSGLVQVISRCPGKITVKFIETGFIKEFDKGAVSKGDIYDPMKPRNFGLGYYGNGEFTSSLDKESIRKALECWNSMFKRCYSEKVHVSHKPYVDCFVNAHWYDFQNFAKFYHEDQYRQAGWELDKDLLVKGNKEYGPDTCVFIPRDINGYLKTNNSRRGYLPIGVSLSYLKDSYVSRCRDTEGKQTTIGKYSTINLAFEAYKDFKSSVLKEKAYFWKEYLDPKVFHALLKYEIHITD